MRTTVILIASLSLAFASFLLSVGTLHKLNSKRKPQVVEQPHTSITVNCGEGGEVVLTLDTRAVDPMITNWGSQMEED